jgi:hypothetical protein
VIKSVDPQQLTDEERMERVKFIDTITLSPSDRATRIHNMIDKLKFPEMVTQWDLMCFCIYYMSFVIQKDNSMLYDSLRRVMYCVNQWHYFYCEDHEEEEARKMEWFAKEKVRDNGEDRDRVWTLKDFEK